MPQTPTVKAAPKAAKPKKEARPLLYPEIAVELRTTGSKKGPLSFKEAKELLGWHEDTPESKFTDWVEEVDLESGRRVQLRNNVRNRPFKRGQLVALEQEHLQGQFVLTPDGLGIGQTGQVISAQHRLVSFVNAELKRLSDTESGAFWRKKWPEPLTMECLVITGLDESDRTFRALNSSAPATVQDCLYRAGHFKGRKSSERANLCKIAENGIREIWKRTGRAMDANASILTIPESVEWFDKHPSFADFVVDIYEDYQANNKGRGEKSEDGEEVGFSSQQRMSAGNAAALMFLMATSQTEREKYVKKPSDKSIDWTWKAKARDFWTELCMGPEAIKVEFQALKNVLDTLYDPENEIGGNIYERKAVICKAWNLFKIDSTWTEEELVIPKSSDGKMTEFPTFGGIDVGEGASPGTAADAEEGLGDADESEIETAKQEAQSEKLGEESAADKYERILQEVKKRFAELHVEHPGKLLLFKGATKAKGFFVWDSDAIAVGKITKIPVNDFPDGRKILVFKSGDLTSVVEKLRIAKKQAKIVTENADGTFEVSDPE